LEGLVIVNLREIIRSVAIESMQDEQIQIEEKWRNRINYGVGRKWGVKFIDGEIKKISRHSLEIE